MAADKGVFFSYQVLSRRRATRPTEDGDTEVARTTPVVFFFKTAPLKTEAWSCDNAAAVSRWMDEAC